MLSILPTIYYTRFILVWVTIYWFAVNRPSTIRPYIVLLMLCLYRHMYLVNFYTSSPSVFLCALYLPLLNLLPLNTSVFLSAICCSLGSLIKSAHF